MKFDQLVILLPCQSLEDFPLQREADEAEQLLSAWSALWHPALLTSAQNVPSWHPAEDPPQQPTGHLVMLPGCSDNLLPAGWLEGAKAAGACVVHGLQHRHQMVAAALAQLDAGPGKVDPELAADFLALGFCHLQVELLTRQLRYMSNLDEESFRREVLAGAEAAAKADAEEARQRLQAAFNLLHEAREYFYPVEAHLLDLTLVAPTTLGQSLRAELAAGVPTNLLVSGEVIDQMARKEPATLDALSEALEKNTAAIVGGEFSETALPLLTPEAIRCHVLRGLDSYRKHLGNRPNVFGRRRFGLSPVLPQILHQLGFVGAMHSTLDDGRFPTGNQSRIRWEGVDGTVLEALARVPIDISRPDAFLRLPEKLGDSMDLDHVATVILAHWPGQSSPWYQDLKRIAAYSPVIGTFATVNKYFEETGMAGQQTQYVADQYRAPYLRQEVVGGRSDPISRWVRYYGRRAALEALQTLDMLAAVAACTLAAEDASSRPSAPAEDDSSRPSVPVGGDSSRRFPLEQLLAEVEDSRSADPHTAEALDRRLRSELEAAAARFSRSLAAPDASLRKGRLLVNPWSFPRRLCVEIPDDAELPDVAGPVRAVGESAGKKSALVDLPAMGFAWVGPGTGAATPSEPVGTKGRWGKRKKQKGDPPLAEENVLRNEFCELTINPRTGGIQSVYDYYTRDARLAQQIALRLPHAGRDVEGDDAHYSIMAADEVAVTSSGPLLGEMVTRGRLVDRQARRLAGFTQTTRVRRGNRIIELQIELDVDRLPEPNPWHSYYAARFAWGDATANLYRSVNLANRPTDCAQLEAPHFIDVRSGKVRTTILTGGLPYHRRFGLRRLDTLLLVRGETARSFRLGIGIDVTHPMHAALDFLAPRTVADGVPSPPAPSGWLFHLDSRNVIATHWEPLSSDGRVDGFRVRLLETDGRKVRVGLRSFRPIRSGQKINSGDDPPDELPVDGDQVMIAMGPHEWVEVEARFVHEE